MRYLKIIFSLILINLLDKEIAGITNAYFIIFPLTFLSYSFYVYKSNSNIGSSEAFFIGLFIDLISDSFLGLNAIFFCLITYLINIYANAFKLFSYLQICIFFGLSSSAYVGLSQMIINIWNFSYVTLFMSTILNIILCILMVILSAYLPNFVKRRL
jgi:rod shape-determining protein MreD|tara:strand:+ start:919 stop:1389 length:471 start_codon:yes stop_codon:yes gene_type:complete